MNNQPDWESICKRCGKCCFEKFESTGGAIFHTRTPCRYLDVVTRKCKIYERRFSINPECVKLTEDMVRTLRWLPGDCGYKLAIKNREI
jgi:uncharacterized cysteine cluster protein YcgN (CxxCxxCC family)